MTPNSLSHVVTSRIADWFQTWLEFEAPALSAQSLKRYRRLANHFLASQPSELLVSQVTHTHIRDYQQMLIREGYLPSTINLYVHSILKRAFKIAPAYGEIQRNPVALVRPIRSVHGQSKSIFTPEQVDSLLSVASEEWRGLILCGCYTGQRLGDLARLRWSDVGELITLTQAKTGRVVQIPIHPKLQTWFDGQIRGIFVFPTLCERTIGGLYGLSNQFSRIVKAAGIEPQLIHERRGMGRSVSALTFHSLRHGFNSALANAGVPQEIRQLLTGHASTRVNDRYTHFQEAAVSQAVFKLS